MRLKKEGTNRRKKDQAYQSETNTPVHPTKELPKLGMRFVDLVGCWIFRFSKMVEGTSLDELRRQQELIRFTTFP